MGKSKYNIKQKKYRFDLDTSKIKTNILEQLETDINNMITVGDKINRDTRSLSLQKFYDTFSRNQHWTHYSARDNARQMNDAMVYGYRTEAGSGNVLRYIIFYSGFDKSKYPYPQRLEKNKDKYPDITDTKDFVFDLAWNQGIVGLPKMFSHPMDGSRVQVAPYPNPYWGGKHNSMLRFAKMWYKQNFTMANIQTAIKRYQYRQSKMNK